MNADSFLALTSNVTSLYHLKSEENLWKELHNVSLEEGKCGLGAVLLCSGYMVLKCSTGKQI